MKDICIYAPGDPNKIGKEGKTRWDSFSMLYKWVICMESINAVQEANRQYDNGTIPRCLLMNHLTGFLFRDVVEAIFQHLNRDEAEAVIEESTDFG